MTLPQPVARHRPLAGVVLSAVVTTVLASCSSNEPAPDAAAASAPARPTASAPATTPAASPTPSPLVPADGENRRSCADGTCEIRVTGRGRVPLPKRFGLGPIEVIAIDAETVTMVVPLTRSRFSSDGGCSSVITGPAANSSAFVNLTCHAGERTVLNGMALEAAGITGEAAVIRIRPAP